MKQLNFQNELHFDFTIEKLGILPLFVQSVSLPGIFTDPPQTGTTFSNIKHIGDAVIFQDLVVSLKADEGMESWFEMYKWLTGIGRSETFKQFRDLINEETKTLDGAKKLFRSKQLDGSKGYKNAKSIGSLTISDANHIKYLELVFVNLHPVSMDGLVFRTDESGVGFMSFNVSFAYDYYYPKSIR
jgi:hypothetical protein